MANWYYCSYPFGVAMIRLNDTHAIKLICELARVRFVPGESHCIAQYNSNDMLMAACLFSDWNRGSVLVHSAVWGGFGALRPIIWLMFQYPFVQLQVKKIFGLVPEWNERARKANLHIGFKIEYLTDDVFGFEDGTPNGMYLMSMRKEDCRWLDMKCPPIEYAPSIFSNRIDRRLVEPIAGMMQ
jgi:hypothetical protein